MKQYTDFEANRDTTLKKGKPGQGIYDTMIRRLILVAFVED